ncbi:MAG: hypothetical protein AB7V58_05035 [Solirubrobacterales bacterium]
MKSSSDPHSSIEGDGGRRRRRYQAFVEVDRDDQIEKLVRLAADAEIGLAVLGPEEGEHLDFVNVVDVAEREDGIYVFAERGDAERFAAAVDHDPQGEETGGEHRAFLEETPVNRGAASEWLIAAERGDALQDLFGPAVAEDVREGLPLEMALSRVQEVGEDGSETADLLHRWIELDARTSAPVSPASGEVGSAGHYVVETSGREKVETIAGECGYSKTEDCPIDSLIDYKNALEDTVVDLLDGPAEACRHLQAWFEDEQTDGKDPGEAIVAPLRIAAGEREDRR